MIALSSPTYLSVLSKTTRPMKNLFRATCSHHWEDDCMLTNLLQLGLDLNFSRGKDKTRQSHMSDAYRGVQRRVRMLHPLAICSHCCSQHELNLVCLAQRNCLRNAMDIVTNTFIFISRSAQCEAIPRKFVQVEAPGATLPGWEDTILLSHFASKSSNPWKNPGCATGHSSL